MRIMLSFSQKNFFLALFPQSDKKGSKVNSSMRYMNFHFDLDLFLERSLFLYKLR